jgi:hypothetical protein
MPFVPCNSLTTTTMTRAHACRHATLAPCAAAAVNCPRHACACPGIKATMKSHAATRCCSTLITQKPLATLLPDERRHGQQEGTKKCNVVVQVFKVPAHQLQQAAPMQEIAARHNNSSARAHAGLTRPSVTAGSSQAQATARDKQTQGTKVQVARAKPATIWRQ